MQDLLKMQLSSLNESHKLNVNKLNENIELSIKVQNSEKELLKYESDLSKLKETVAMYQTVIVDLSFKCVELESVNLQIVEKSEKVAARNLEVVEQLELENSKRREETEMLARKLAERVRAAEVANQQVIDTNNDLEVVKRQNTARVKELTKELNLTKRKLDNIEKSGGGEGSPFNLAVLGTNEVSQVSVQEPVHGSRHREVHGESINSLKLPDTQQLLVEKIEKLKKASLLKNTKIYVPPHKRCNK